MEYLGSNMDFLAFYGRRRGCMFHRMYNVCFLVTVFMILMKPPAVAGVLCFRCARYPSLLDDGCSGLPADDVGEVAYGLKPSAMPPIDDCGEFGVCTKIIITRAGETISEEHECERIADEKLRPEEGCYEVPLEDGLSNNCYCREDYCNLAAPRSQRHHLLLMTAATLSTVVLTFVVTVVDQHCKMNGLRSGMTISKRHVTSYDKQ